MQKCANLEQSPPLGTKGTRGILNPLDGLAHFSLDRALPPPDLAPFVENFWSVRWNLEGRAPFEQEILPYPCVNLSLEAAGFAVHGPGTQRFVAHLTGRGHVFGTKFTPAGFFAFARVAMRGLVDRVLPVDEATGRSLAVPADPATAWEVMTSFLRSFTPAASDDLALVNRLVALAQDDRDIMEAQDLARVAGASVRSLHRLFERYVGVGPKWIVRRSRVQEAAERVARGERVRWAVIARDLGYHDQAHLIRDFRAQVGATPAAYARRCASVTAARATARAPR